MKNLVLLISIFLVNGPVQAAMTCSDRIQVCDRYCIRSMNDSPGCHSKCKEIRQECLSTGCWESKITAKQCGIGRS
jgi:hypothetical protein